MGRLIHKIKIMFKRDWWLFVVVVPTMIETKSIGADGLTLALALAMVFYLMVALVTIQPRSYQYQVRNRPRKNGIIPFNRSRRKR